MDAVWWWVQGRQPRARYIHFFATLGALRIARHRSICLSTLENTPLNGTKSKAGVGVAAALSLSDVSVACRMKKTEKG